MIPKKSWLVGWSEEREKETVWKADTQNVVNVCTRCSSQQSICCITRVRLNEYCPEMKIYIGETATTTSNDVIPPTEQQEFNKSESFGSDSAVLRRCRGKIYARHLPLSHWGKFVYVVWLKHWNGQMACAIRAQSHCFGAAAGHM